MRTSSITAADRLARWIAYVVNPLILPPLLFGAILVQFGASAREVGTVTGISLLLLTVSPLLFLVWMIRAGRAASFESFDRSQRGMPFAVGIACAATTLACLILFVETARPVVVAVGVCVVASTMVLALVNLRWKISIHSAAAGGFVAVLVYAAYLAGSFEGSARAAPAAALVPLVMWSRVRTQSHTPAEVLAGAVLGIFTPSAALFVLDQTGLFAGI